MDETTKKIISNQNWNALWLFVGMTSFCFGLGFALNDIREKLKPAVCPDRQPVVQLRATIEFSELIMSGKIAPNDAREGKFGYKIPIGNNEMCICKSVTPCEMTPAKDAEVFEIGEEKLKVPVDVLIVRSLSKAEVYCFKER